MTSDRLQEALEWYANLKSWEPDAWNNIPADVDNGARARAALTGQPDATAPASSLFYFFEGTGWCCKKHYSWCCLECYKESQARELPPAAPPAQVLSEEQVRIAINRSLQPALAREVVSIEFLTKFLNDALRSPASTKPSDAGAAQWNCKSKSCVYPQRGDCTRHKNEGRICECACHYVVRDNCPASTSGKETL